MMGNGLQAVADALGWKFNNLCCAVGYRFPDAFFGAASASSSRIAPDSSSFCVVVLKCRLISRSRRKFIKADTSPTFILAASIFARRFCDFRVLKLKTSISSDDDI